MRGAELNGPSNVSTYTNPSGDALVRISRTKIGRDAAQLTLDLRRAIGGEIRRARVDAGVSQAALARAAEISPAHLSKIERGTAEASVDALQAIAVALGGRVSLRLHLESGPAIHDRTQAPMVEALLRIVHPRWKRFVEVPVHRPAEGVIDVVLHDPAEPRFVCLEAESGLRRVEQQLRWSGLKTESLPSSQLWAFAGPEGAVRPSVSRVLLLRSTRATREIVNALPGTFATAFPAPAAAIRDALMSPSARWPGDGVLWASVDGSTATILPGPPRGVEFGR
jgi:transcriptional regulator with XRE-family HTH domain